MRLLHRVPSFSLESKWVEDFAILDTDAVDSCREVASSNGKGVERSVQWKVSTRWSVTSLGLGMHLRLHAITWPWDYKAAESLSSYHPSLPSELPKCGLWSYVHSMEPWSPSLHVFTLLWPDQFCPYLQHALHYQWSMHPNVGTLAARVSTLWDLLWCRWSLQQLLSMFCLCLKWPRPNPQITLIPTDLF